MTDSTLPPTMVPERLFTVSEANRTLPLIRRIVADAMTTGRALKELAHSHRPPAELDEEARRLMTRLEALVAEFEQVGCSYRDWNFEYGLVDFPAMIDGHRVQLCWRSDEPSILFYHGVNEGYAGRMAIPEDYREDTGRVTGAEEPVK